MTAARSLLLRLGCSLWGHVVDNDVFRRAAGPSRQCRCGSTYLVEDGSSPTCATPCPASCGITPTSGLRIGAASTGTCVCGADIRSSIRRATIGSPTVGCSPRRSGTRAGCSATGSRLWPRGTGLSNTRATAGTAFSSPAIRPRPSVTRWSVSSRRTGFGFWRAVAVMRNTCARTAATRSVRRSGWCPGLVFRLRSPVKHRGWRCARLTRRDDREY